MFGPRDQTVRPLTSELFTKTVWLLDRRQVIARKMLMQHGRLAHRSVGANQHRQQIKARLVREHDGPALLQSPLFSFGHLSAFHRSMASSSRWSARRAGFCRESP